MEEPKALDSLFTNKIFRIPDYQRGYAWQPIQLKDFWEDLVNLSDGRSHYANVLTLKEVAQGELLNSDNVDWLTDDHSYTLYQIVDGQQRLTTFVIFIQALINVFKNINGNQGKSDTEIFITDYLNIRDITDKYIYKTKPSELFRSYKFGYEVDNPSHNYLRFKIFNENGAPEIRETFYTLNLNNANIYFYNQLHNLYEEEGITGLQKIYKKITKRFLFNEYIIKDEFDVFVAF